MARNEELLDPFKKVAHPARAEEIAAYMRQQCYLSYDDVPKLSSLASSYEWWDSIDHFAPIFGNIVDGYIPQPMIDFGIHRIAINHQLAKKEKNRCRTF